MRHEDYVYAGEFEQSDYWKDQRAENRKRLDEFRERRAPEIEAERRARIVMEQIQRQERIARQNEEWANSTATSNLKDGEPGIRYPISGVGPAFVVPGRHETMPRYILRWVSFIHDIKVMDIIGPRRYRELVWARQHAFYELRSRTNLSSTQIGRMCGNRDHTTVLHGIKTHAKRYGLPHLRASDHWRVRAPVLSHPGDHLSGPDGMFIKEVLEAKEIKKP